MKRTHTIIQVYEASSNGYPKHATDSLMQDADGDNVHPVLPIILRVNLPQQ